MTRYSMMEHCKAPITGTTVWPQTPEGLQIVVVKMFNVYNGFYTSLELDELVMFNRALEEREIQAL